MKLDHGLKVVLEKGPRKLQIMKLLARTAEPIGSETIAKELGMSKGNVIRILNELEKREAVKCVTSRKRDRRFEITPKGKGHISLIK